MRRWNGWGDDSYRYELSATALRFLQEKVGLAKPPDDISLAAALAAVPASRLKTTSLIVTDAETRLRHARGQSLPDWIALRSGQIGGFPDGVAFPQNADDVQALVRYAQITGAELIPYGGGTSVVGHINPRIDDRPVLTVDMGRMNRLLRLDETSRLATFGAGVNGPVLEAYLRAHNFTLGHFPQSFEYSTLGGWIATRSSGQQSLRYGRIEHLFAGGQIISPAGTLLLPANFPASAAGPDLREMVLGSEGRLGIITEATVRIRPLPEKEAFLAIFFPDFESGFTTAREIVQSGLSLSLLRLSTPVETRTTLAMAGHAFLINMLEKYLSMRGTGENKCLLLLGSAGDDTAVKRAHKEAIAIAGQQKGVYAGQRFGKLWHKNRFKTPYLRNALWEAGYAIDTLETATSWSGVQPLLSAIEEALAGALGDSEERIHVFTHLSHLYPYGSSIYVQYIFRITDTPAATYLRWQKLKSAASEAIIHHGGTISHQHGIGLDHRPYLAAEKGALGIAALQALVQTFDPQGIMNPGKLIP